MRFLYLVILQNSTVKRSAISHRVGNIREYFSSKSASARFNQAYRRSILSNHAN